MEFSDQCRVVERSPTIDEYQMLRSAVGWAEVDRQVVETGLAGALYSVCIMHRDEIIGCGRIVGDGGIYLYIQDVIVLPQWQKRGLGRMIMCKLMAWIETHAGQNTFVALMAASGVAEFYRSYGFAERPANRPGMYRMWDEVG